MNIKSILASLALVTATSTVAMADVRDHRTEYQPQPEVIVRDHRTETVVKPVVKPVVIQQPVVHYQYRINDRFRDHDWNRYEPAQPKLFISNPTINSYGGNYVGSLAWSNGQFISQPTRIDNHREDFAIGGTSRFNTVELVGAAGSSNVTQVTVEFADHSAQYIKLGQTLRAGQTITLDLQGHNRMIQRVFVYGSTNSGAAYQLILK